MTQSTEQLVRAFKARGGKVRIIPHGTSGECVEKSFWRRIHTPQVKANFTEAKEAHLRNKRAQRGWCHRWRVPVDVAMARNMEAGE